MSEKGLTPEDAEVVYKASSVMDEYRQTMRKASELKRELIDLGFEVSDFAETYKTMSSRVWVKAKCAKTFSKRVEV